MTVNCVVCKCANLKEIFKWEISHRECEACGHVFVFPLPSLESSLAVHSDGYSYSPEYEDSIDAKERPAWFRHLEFSDNKSFLDVGCASGKLLATIRNAGYIRIAGIEVNDELADYGRKKGLPVATGHFDSECFKGEYFDYIHLGDVLEHIPDIDSVIINVKRLLSSGGKVIITTPNLDSLWSRLTRFIFNKFKVPWSSLTPPYHVNNFTERSLSQFLLRYGFKVVDRFESKHTFLYSLGSLNLRRAFLEKPSVISLGRMILGYSLYVLAQLTYWLVIPWRGSKFKMTLVGEVDSADN